MEATEMDHHRTISHFFRCFCPKHTTPPFWGMSTLPFIPIDRCQVKKTWNFKDVVDPKTRTFAVSWPFYRNKSTYLKLGYLFSQHFFWGDVKSMAVFDGGFYPR